MHHVEDFGDDDSEFKRNKIVWNKMLTVKFKTVTAVKMVSDILFHLQVYTATLFV
jgi:hypothetical protein